MDSKPASSKPNKYRSKRTIQTPSIRTSLFSRIIFRLSLPLFILAAGFCTIELTNQIQNANELHQIESQFTLENLRPILEESAQQLNSIPSEEIRKRLESASEFHQVEDIDFYQIVPKKLFWDKHKIGWGKVDFYSLSRAFQNETGGHNYFIRIDKDNKRLVAYIPFKNKDGEYEHLARIIFSLANIRDILIQARWSLALMFIFVLLTGVSIALGLTKIIIRPLRSLTDATREITEGHFGKHVEVHTGDEIEVLARIFNQMSDYLIDMKTQAEDANPLTQLPGNQGIYNELKKRIHERYKFVLFHIDLDRFKVFNDHFGLARGDEVIKKTADLLRRSVEIQGSPDDFVGHQGGDDFILICRATHAEAVGSYIVSHFDGEIVKSLYRKEDLERGYILQIDRRRLAETGEEKMAKFPLIAISLAGVSNAKKDFADYFDCMERAVSVKKEVKQKIESCYIIKT